MKKGLLVGLLAGIVIAAGSAAAASRWVITSTHQIKPSVLRHLSSSLTVKQVVGNAVTVYPMDTIGSPGQSTANCPRGYKVVGGGWEQGQIPVGSSTIDDSTAQGNGWFVQMENTESGAGSGPGIFKAVAECAK